MNFELLEQFPYVDAQILSGRKMYALEVKMKRWMKALGLKKGRLVVELPIYQKGMELNLAYGAYCLIKDVPPKEYYFWGFVDYLGEISGAEFPRGWQPKLDRVWVLGAPEHGLDFRQIRRIGEFSQVDLLPCQKVESRGLSERVPELLARRLIEYRQYPKGFVSIPFEFRCYTKEIEWLSRELGFSLPFRLTRERLKGSAGEIDLFELKRYLRSFHS